MSHLLNSGQVGGFHYNKSIGTIGDSYIVHISYLNGGYSNYKGILIRSGGIVSGHALAINESIYKTISGVTTIKPCKVLLIEKHNLALINKKFHRDEMFYFLRGL